MSLTCTRVERHDLRVGYTLPSLVATLYRADGDPIDLSTTVTEVRFVMRRQAKDVAAKIDRAITVEDAAAGIVRVNFLPADVDERASYDAWFVVVFNDGNDLPVPNPGYITVVVGRG